MVGQAKVPAVMIVRNLGTWLDTNFTMSAHINETCQAAIYHLYNIKRISRYLSYDDRKSIVQAVIMSRIDYCNSLLVGVPSTQLSKLQRLQNAAACIVSNIAKYDHITPTLVNLHWFPVKYRVNFKIAMLAHKCIYGNAPEYLKDLIKLRVPPDIILDRTGRCYLRIIVHDQKKTLGDRTFKVAGLESETFY